MLIITQAGYGEQTITKSRFHAAAMAADSERAVGNVLRQFAATHANAHHLAYAFRIKTPAGIVQRFSDAGEPSGTAGMPILKLIEGRDLINVAVAVIRYYGGINLGTGGLARAYGGTAKMALDVAKTAPYVEMQEIQLKIAYHQMDLLNNLLAKCNGSILEKNFNADIDLVVRLPKEDVPHVVGRLSKYGIS